MSTPSAIDVSAGNLNQREASPQSSERGYLTALVLGAGLSRRFGQPKQLLPYRGTTLLNWAVTQAEASPALDAVIVVLGRPASRSLPA